MPFLTLSRLCVCVVLSPVQFYLTPWTVARQAPLSMALSRQENEWIAISSSKESPQPRDQTRICTGGFFTTGAT